MNIRLNQLIRGISLGILASILGCGIDHPFKLIIFFIVFNLSIGYNYDIDE